MLFMVRPDRKSVHLLADLLETIEVTADELLDQKFPAHELAAVRAMSDVEVQEQLAALRRFVARVQALELAIVAKLGQARERARQVARTDWRLRSILILFTSGTQAFADLIAAEASASSKAFNGASQMFPYLRSRGLLRETATHYDGSVELLVTDGFRLMGALQLRDLMERCEATLNALDTHYDLYDLEETDAEEAASAQETEPLQVKATVAEPAPSPAAVTADTAAQAPVNWGDSLPPLEPQATAPEPQAVLTSIVATAGTVPDPAPTEDEIAKAQEASEAGLKSLADRLAELKSEPAAPATSAAPAAEAEAAPESTATAA